LPPLTELEELQGDTTDPEKVLEEGLEKFLNNRDANDLASRDDVQQGLEEIESLIATAEGAGKEIYESPEHAAIAEENRLALEAFQVARSRRRSKSLKYEDLTGATSAIELATVVEMPEISTPSDESLIPN